VANVWQSLCRCRIVEHQGHNIARIDLRDLDGGDLLHGLGEVGRFLDTDAADVRLVLTDVTGTPLTTEAAELAKKLVVKRNKHSTRSAIVGINPINMGLADRIKSGIYFARDVGDALVWLTWEGKRLLR
jgi:hypothetical protein